MILNSILNKKAKQLRENLDSLWSDILQRHHDSNINKLDLVPFYTSIDLRHSSFKIAPIDTNIFPAGFHHLSDESKKNATKLMGYYLANALKNKNIYDCNILLVAENFDRNQQYLANIIALEKILEGTKAKIKKINLFDQELDQLREENYYSDIVVLNADLTSGLPDKLIDLTQSWVVKHKTKTKIIPSILYGWYQRSKFRHFELYNQLVEMIAKQIGFDPWLCSTNISFCDEIDFRALQGADKLAQIVDDLIAKTKQKYIEYGINQDPYAIVKADNGTFGMGIVKVNSGDDVLNFNKKIRHKMATVRDGVENHKVIIQEGIPSNLTNLGLSTSGPEYNSYDISDNGQTEAKVAERVLYLTAGQIVGTMLRSVPNKNESDILNATGMVIETENSYAPSETEMFIAELASIAAILELDTFLDHFTEKSNNSLRNN